MADIGGLYGVLQIITDFFPIALMIGIVLLLFAMVWKMLEAAGVAKGGIVGKLRLDKKMIIAMLSLLILGFGAMPAQGAVALQLDSQTVFGGTVITLKATGLTSATEYTIFASGNTEDIANVTFTASDSTEFIPMPVPDEGDGVLSYNIAESSLGIAAAADATVFVTLTDATDFLQEDLFLNMMVPLIIIAVVVGIVVALLKSF